MSGTSSNGLNNDLESITAVDYIENQIELEKEAKEIMPFDPNECTYEQGELRQTIFACLTCSKENNDTPIGVCYSCSIQCHSNHDLVELFTKRNFVCDCGTTRMSKTTDGACKLRRTSRKSNGTSRKSSNLELPAEDIPSSTNRYNQNFTGRFCGCEQIYNPLEETGHMIQCYFGFTCGEDWYHDKCIMGFKPDAFKQSSPTQNELGENMLDRLSPPGIDAGLQLSGYDQNDNEDMEKLQQDAKEAVLNEQNDQNEDSIEQLKYFPKLSTFDQYICWNCVEKFKEIFNLMDIEIPGCIHEKLPRFEGINTLDDWIQLKNKISEPDVKKMKSEHKKSVIKEMYSIFLSQDFKQKIKSKYETLEQSSKLRKFLENNQYLFEDDPVYQPPTDQSEEEWSTTVSYLDMCAADALHSLPKGKAIESIQAYDRVRSKLRDFFKPFAEQGKVVTEDEVKQFFGKFNNEDN